MTSIRSMSSGLMLFNGFASMLAPPPFACRATPELPTGNGSLCIRTPST